MLTDAYDILGLLISHAAKSGLGESLVAEASALLQKLDPKIAEKVKAAQAQAAKDAQDWEEFQAFKRFQAQDASPAPAPAEQSAPAV